MRVGLVVERRYFAVPVAPVERLRFGQGLVGFESEQRQPAFPREVFEAQEDPGPEAQTTSGGRDPHALDLAIGRVTLQRSEEHTSELQSHSDLVCRLLLEKKNKHITG